ncbi:MAG: hypothetical protein ABXS93_07820 [Sulfurimonas sp.]
MDSEKKDSIAGFELGYGMNFDCTEDGCPELQFKIMAFDGKTDYVGSYIGSGQPYGSVKSTTKNTLYDVSLDMIQNVENKGVDIIYGVGIGFHSWYRELSSYQNELYSWFYITPIIGVSKEISDGFNVGTSLKYKYAIDPKMVANTIDEDFELGGVNTFEVSVPLTYSINEEIDVFAAYTYAQQKIKKSDYVLQGAYLYYEPKSTDNQQYVKVGVTFNY